jgi:hypothetical protein
VLLLLLLLLFCCSFLACWLLRLCPDVVLCAQDTLSVALSLPCFHSFCSLCIRRCLHLNASCPLCHAAASSGELRPNFALTQIAQLVHHLDAEVQRSVQRHVEKWARKYLPHIAIDEATANEDMAAPRTAAAAAALNNRSNATAAAAGSASVAAVSTSAAAVFSSTGTASNSSSSALPSATAKVECPCCGLSIVAARINRHLDACLGKEDNQKTASDAAAAAAAAASASAISSAASTSSNARLPFPVYNMLSEKQLRKLLTDLGFPSGAGGGGIGGGSAAGLDHSREALVRRHREFVLRHNSELDASGCGLRPALSDAALVKDIVRKERARNTHTQGRQAKQSLLNAFASPNNDPPASAGAASLPQPPPAMADVEASHAVAGAGTASARKRRKRTPSAAALATTAPLKSPRRLTNSTPAIFDLSSDDITLDDPHAQMRDVATTPASTAETSTSPRSLRSRAPLTAEHAAATADAVPPVGASTPAAAAGPSLASFSSSSDPYASLIASYEAKHGPRRRWKRRWGMDDALYPKKETIELLGDESPTAPAAAVAAVDATGALATTFSDAPVAVAAAASSSSSPKAVFSLFQPATAAAPSHATSTSSSSTGATAAAAAAATVGAPLPAAMNASGGNGGAGSSSSNSGNRSNRSSHSSKLVRVSKVLCSNCRATCRGNFPLGASVMCPKCRPAWTSKLPPAATAAASNHSTHDDTAPPAPLKPTGWMAKAQQQQQQQQRSASTPLIPPAPADSVASIVPAASPSSVSSPPPLSSSSSSSSVAAASSVLSAAQQSAIEERRAAALAKLRHKPRMTDSIPAATTASDSDKSNNNDNIVAPDAERGAVPMQVEEEKTSPQAHSL